MRPIITLISEIPKAHPKPIFLFLPRQPTPYANATAITIKRVCPYFTLFVYFEFCRKYSERFGLGQVCLLHKPCGGMIFPNNDICLQEKN